MATANEQNVMQDRRSAWANMASTPMETADDLYEVKKQATGQVGLDDYQYQKKQGIMSSFFKGLPDDPEYRPSFGESLAAGTTEFVRSGANVAAELWSDDRRDARESIESLRKVDPEFADELEKNTIGKKPTGAQLALRGTAAIAEGALTFLPMFKAGRLAVGAAEAAMLTKLGRAGKVISSMPGLKTMVSGSLYGSIYGGTYGAHTGENAKDILKDIAVGGLSGGVLAGTGVLVGKTISASLNRAQAIGKTISAYSPNWAKNNMVVDFFRSSGSRLENGFGDVGKNFMNMYRQAVKVGSADLGRIHLSMIDNGLVAPPSAAKKFFKNVEYVGDNQELMGYYNKVLRGQGAFSDPVIRADAIASDSRLTYLDEMRKWYGTTAQREGVVESLLDLDTYLPKYTKEVLLKQSTAVKLSKAATQAEREAIYAANDPLVKEMVENSVYNEKAFKTLEESYEHYYDYVDFVESGGRLNVTDNKFLQRMVMRGEAKNIDEAAGKLINDMKWKKKSLTPMATSLDFKREVDLPWYDPNPGRVMPSYAVDASMRLSMAKTFGRNDELINEMKGKISNDVNRGAAALEDAKQFEKLVRVVTGQVERSPKAERISQTLRAINVPKLAFAQVLNVGQNLNYLLATDLNSTIYGLQTVFRNEQMRKAIESGVLVNNLLREVFDYSTGGGRIADKILKYTGFTWTETFNRATGAVVAERWALRNYQKFMQTIGFDELEEEAQKKVLKMIHDKNTAENMALNAAIGIQKDFIDQYKNLFPNDDFQIAAGNLGAVKNRLAKLESDIEPKIEKLQKARQILQDELVNESIPLTDQYLVDIQESIDMLRTAVSAGQEPKMKVPFENVEPVKVHPQEAVSEAIDGAVNIRKEQLQGILSKLEEKYAEVQVGGGSYTDVPKPVMPKDPTSQDLGQYLAGVNGDIKAIDGAILGLQNELADKSSLLEGMVDSYSLAEKRVAKDFPQGTAYDKFIEKRKTEFSRKTLTKQAADITKKNGGVTITLDGDVPQNGYVVAKRKDTEAFKPMEEWKAEDIDVYINEHADLLDADNAHLGIWVDDGKVYMDVSTVLPDKTEALITARNADQIGIFDLNSFETLYTRDYEKNINDALARGGVEVPVDGVAPQIEYKKVEAAMPRLTQEERALKELGIDVEEAKLRGFLAPDDFVSSAQSLVEKTQFAGRSSDLPAFASTPMGKVIFQFKTFAYQQMKFLTKELKDNAQNNPKKFLRNIMILGAVFPMVGEVLADVRSLLTQEKRPTKAFDRYMSDLASAGAWGLALDFWNSAERGKTIEFGAGVTISDAAKYLEQVGVPAAKGEFEKAGTNLTKQLLRQSGAGRIIVNTAFPSSVQGETTWQSLLDWSGDEE